MDWQKTLETLGLKVEDLSKIRLGKGVVGKTSHVGWLVVLVFGIAIYKFDNDWMRFVLVLILALGFYWYFKQTRDFAEKNPALALLEGAELIQYRKMEYAAKGLPNPPDAPSVEANDQVALSGPES